mgnify:CR=1 FL=1
MIGSVFNGVSLTNVQNNPYSQVNPVSESNKNFKTLLLESLQQINQQQVISEQLNEQLALGQVENLHDVLIASEKAGLSLQLLIQVRNRVVEAYQEIMRMQI